MANFWDNGLKGDNRWDASGSISYPYPSMPELNNCRIIGSLSMNPNAPIGTPYRVLLNTFSTGAQVYVEFSPANYTFTLTYPTVHNISGVSQGATLILKKGDLEVNCGSLGSPEQALGYFTQHDAGVTTFSVYYMNYQSATQTNPFPPAKAFPRGGAGAGLTNQIAMVANDSGCHFYIVGFPSAYEINDVTYSYNAPAIYLGTITAEYLNNRDLLDPNIDANDATSTDFGPGGGIGGLPTAPDYPGSDIDFPDLPSGASAFGFSKLRLYKPTSAQLASALDILYSDSTETTLETIVESCKKWWYKPDQYCISLMLSPISANTGTNKNIKFGKYDSEIAAPVVTDQFQVVDMGTVQVPLQYGSFLDFSGYAVAKIFLPFVGFRSLNVDEIMGSTITCKYYVDMLSGSAIAMLRINRPGSNNSVYYNFDCNVNVQVPLTCESYSTIVSSILSAGVAAVSAGVSAGIAAPIGVAAAGSIAAHGGAPDLTQSGNLNGNSGVMGGFTPYICIQFPVASTPAHYNNIKGKPADEYVSLGSVSGFTVVDNCHLEGITTATDEEIKEIENMLKSGVIF